MIGLYGLPIRRLGLPLIAFIVLGLGGCAGNGPKSKPDEAVVPPAASQQPMLRLARAAHAAGDYASAVNLYRTIVAGSPSPAISVELGDTLLDAGSFDDAITSYTAVPAKSPVELEAALGLERAYLALGDVAKAMEQAERAHALAPEDSRVLIGRGIALDLSGRHAEAQASYNRLLAKFPGDRAARVDLALSLALTKDFNQATQILTPIARSSNATARERQDLALIYGLEGDKEEAMRWSKLDLDSGETSSNLQFYDFIRAANH